MNLHVVAYPTLTPADYDLIQSYRSRYNSLYRVIEPHFTLVFSVPDIDIKPFVAEIRAQAGHFGAIPFCLRCAVINKDSFSNHYDAFLVPDEGFGRIVKLHDRLYSGLLSPHHRLDISYIPHISIANSTDAQAVKSIVDDWNANGRDIPGTIAALDVVNYENRKITTLERIDLTVR